MKTLLQYFDKQILIAIMSVLFGQSIVAQTTTATTKFDQLTKRQVVTTVTPILNFKGLTKATTGSNILWDKTHGVLLSYEPSGNYASLSALLSGLGYTITTTAAGVNNVDLALYDVVVVCLASNYDTPYTSAEISALNTFVQNGGGLLILGDNYSTNNQFINPLAQQFGITCGVSDISEYLTNLQAAHPVFFGVDSIYTAAGGELTVTSSATLIARDVSEKGAVAVAQAGAGRVLASGDCNIWDNERIVFSDNQNFAANVFNWLARGADSTSPHITVTPTSFNVSLLSGDSTTRTLTIGNAGASSLTWSIGSPTTIVEMASRQLSRRTESEIARIEQAVKGKTNGTSAGNPTVSPYRWQDLLGTTGVKHILAWAGYSDKSAGGEFENTINAIKEYYTNFTLDTTATTSPTVFSSLLADKDIVLVPEQEEATDLTSLGSSFASSLNSFVQSGKTLIVMDHGGIGLAATSFLNGTGLLEITNPVNGAGYTAVIHDAGSPLVVGLPSQFAAMNGSNYHTSSNGQKIVRELSTGNNMVTQRNIGAGRVIYIGMDFYNYNSEMARLLANAVQSTASTSDFISVDPQSGTVAPGLSQNVTVKVNARGLQAGNYSGNISITNNDPANNPKNVPVDLTVTGPVIASVAPNNASQGQTLAVTITGQNTNFRVVQGTLTFDANHVWFSQGSSTINATSVTVSNATSLIGYFTLPVNASPGLWNVSVEQPAAKGTVTLANGFTITSASSVILVSPNGGENWPSGSGQYLQWTSSGVSYVKLEFSTNGGSTWNLITDSYPALAEAGLRSSSMDRELQKQRLLMRDAISSPVSNFYLWTVPNSPSTSCLVRVTDASNPSKTDLSDGYFTISSGSIGGPGWLTQLNDASKSFIGIKAVDTLIAWAYGGNTVMRTTNGGSTWLEAKGNLVASGFYAMEATNGSIAWGGTSSGQIYYTSDGGTTWTQQTSLGVYIDAIKLVAANTLIATSDPPSPFSPYVILRTTNSGTSWSQLASGVPNSDSTGDFPWYNFDAVGGMLWFGTSSGRIVRSSDFGLSWSVASHPLSTAYGVGFRDASVGVASGTGGNIVRTTDGGTTWNSVSSGTTASIRACQLLKGKSIGWSAGSNGVVVKSVNSGVNWTPENSGTINTLYGVSFVSENVGWVVGSGVILKYSPSTAPMITSVNPTSATQGQTLPVTITGQNTSFRVAQASSTIDANNVWFSQGSSTINAYSVTVSSATNLTANFSIPNNASTGLWNVNVEQPSGKGTVSLANGFTINPGGGGTMMSLSEAEIDFIGVRIGQTSDITFTIRDSSISTGNLSGNVSITGSGFTLISGGGSFNLSPGQGLSVVVRFNAASAGFLQGTLTITNNSINYPASVAVPVRGYGVQLAATPKKILFDTTHGFMYGPGFGYFSEVVKLLRAAGHTVSTGPFNLAGMDGLVTAVQQQSFTLPEIAQIQSFVNNGGTMLVLADYGGYYGRSEQNKTLAAAGWTTGIRIDSSLVSDASRSLYSDPNIFKMFNFPVPSDPLLSNIDTLGAFYSASLTISSPAQVIVSTSSGGGTAAAPAGLDISREGVSTREVSLLLRNLRGTSNPKDDETISAKMTLLKERVTSPETTIPLVAKVGIGTGQIVVIGDGNMFTDPFPATNYGGPVCIRYAANRIFALNIFQNSGSLLPTPRIQWVRDVPNDNGKQVFVRWTVGQLAVSGGIARFGVWRKDTVWTFLKDSVLAVNDSTYQFVAPTIYDSTKAGGMRYSVFRVSAHSVNPAVFSMSQPDSGYSLDNLAPSVPKGVKGTIQAAGAIALLQWNKVPEKDLRYYAVYRSETAGFTHVDSTTFVGASADTTFRDSTVVYGKKYYYRIVAFDWSGNRSDPSDPIALTITSVGRVGVEIPKEFSLAQNYPNPFNPSTIIRYGIPTQSRVLIEIFNSIGQRVATLTDDERGAGFYEVEWHAAVASGIYIYRIEAVAVDNPGNAFIQVKKMVFVR